MRGHPRGFFEASSRMVEERRREEEEEDNDDNSDEDDEEDEEDYRSASLCRLNRSALAPHSSYPHAKCMWWGEHYTGVESILFG